MMRGYRHLRAEGRLDSIVALKDALANAPYSRTPRFSSWFFGAAHRDAERAVRQYLMVHVAGQRLQEALLVAAAAPGGEVSCPLPAPWQQCLRNAGVRVNRWKSTAGWWSVVLVFLANGCRAVFGACIDVARPSAKRMLSRDAACFLGLAAGNLPQPGPEGRSFDVLSWYAQWPDRAPGVLTLLHTVAGTTDVETAGGYAVKRVSDAVPRLSDRRAGAALAVWSLTALGLSTLDLLRGRWWHALMLSQAVLARKARLQKDHLAADYLFHNGLGLYRPLWSYEAARGGSRILFYFYSTNVEPFKEPEGYPRQPHTWHLATWPEFLVWDHANEEFIRREVSDQALVQVVGPIWFHGSGLPMPEVPPQSVAVFDVQPYRDYIYEVVVASRTYYTPEVVGDFLRDIMTALEASNRPMVFKRKRQLHGHAAHGAYRGQVRQMDGAPGVVTVNPDIAAWRVVESCAAVISIPFTSTALIGRAQGKPSIYYVPEHAPFFPVQKDDRAARGIPVVSGPEELSQWLASLPAVQTGSGC